LPVELRQRPVEPRITRLFRDLELALGVAVEPTDEVVEDYRQTDLLQRDLLSF
jgi:hypothetical protein